MIAYNNLTPGVIARECQAAMTACDEDIARIVATPAGQRTFQNTFVAL